MHKINEFLKDGKVYLMQVQSAEFKKTLNEGYLLKCHLKQRGEQLYYYDKENNTLTQWSNGLVFWLTKESEKPVLQCIETAEQAISLLSGGETLGANERGKAWYKRCGVDTYTILLALRLDNGDVSYSLHFNINWKSIGEIIPFNWTMKDCSENPFYQAALAQNDTILCAQMRLHYRIETPEDCVFLEKVFNKRILPKLSEEFDRKYVVDAATIEGDLLVRSGYRMWHRPYFNMRHSTYCAYTLNPHTKEGVDAASVDEVPITFQEYLQLFEKSDIIKP